jgi:hypothetical protein
MNQDAYTVHMLHVIAVIVLILLSAIVGTVAIAIWPKIKIWREKVAIRQRDDARFLDELAERRARVRRPDDAERYGMTPTFRRNTPLVCSECGATFDSLTAAVVHQCSSERVS